MLTMIIISIHGKLNGYVRNVTKDYILREKVADQGKWFKLWVSALNDPHLDNLDISDFGRWAKLGAYIKEQGTEGEIVLSYPSRTLVAKMQLPDFNAMMICIQRFPNISVTLVTNEPVSYSIKCSNWLKYQGDYSTPRVYKFRTKKAHLKRSKKRGEEKRGEETRREEKKKYGEYKNVLLSDAEHQKLKERFNSDSDKWIKTLDEGIQYKGYKYKSHYLAILKWAENEQTKRSEFI